MNIAEFSIRKRVTTWLIVVLMLGGGIFGFENLGRYEEPEFTYKVARVITQYPGATPQEVEQEVTDKLEKAIQTMPQVKELRSVSISGESIITIVMKDKYDKHTLPQVWDELRRKVNDVTPLLPPGVQKPFVYDDFGDVYGMYYAITGKDYSYKEIKDYADYLKKHLSLVPGVGRVILSSQQQEAIFVDISIARLSQLGISLEQIFKTLASQNLVFDAGSVSVGDEYIRIQPTGQIDSVTAIGDLLIQSSQSEKQFYLSDIATITQDYVEIPRKIAFYNGKPAITMGISIVVGGNVVNIGQAVQDEIIRLTTHIPIGIEISPIYQQSKAVTKSISAFMINLLAALLIVVAVLLVSMGLRSGLIIASALWITIFGTFLFMYLFQIDLQRISLGALVLALGMLVDNAIVVAEGILVRFEKGMDKLEACKVAVSQTIWPLLGATIVGIAAFAPIGLSQDMTGEYMASLFYVILISIFLSWILAITVTPMFCYCFLEIRKPKKGHIPHQNFIYRFYKSFLVSCLHQKWLTIIIMACIFATSIYGFKYVKQSFFPYVTTPLFYIGFWKHQGTDIRATREDMLEIQNYIQSIKGVSAVTTIIGKGALRLMLNYTPENPNYSYGQFLIETNDHKDIDQISQHIKQYIRDNYPDSETKVEKIKLGAPIFDPIQVRVSGTDPEVLRRLSVKIKEIMRANPYAIDIKDNWRQKVKVVEPVFSERQARITGITRADLAKTLEMSFSGKQAGIYREADKLIPIITRPPDPERLNISTITSLTIWSTLLQRAIPIGQMVSKFNTAWENARIHHFNQKRTITVSCAAQSILTNDLFKALRPDIENIELPDGYEIEWGGEYSRSKEAQTSLATKIPLGFLIMFLTVLILFNSVKKTLIIWLCVPLAVIGVTFGLLITNISFGFAALLGFLSLSGMLIMNAIILINEIDFQLERKETPYDAIINASLNRMRPILLTAITTIFGMTPLLTDVFFASMAVTIMFGLAFATVLTLIFVPVLYAVFYKVKSPIVTSLPPLHPPLKNVKPSTPTFSHKNIGGKKQG